MTIGGLQKITLTDFPGRLAAVLFTRGCNFRCPYCHNPELVDPRCYAEPIPDEEVFAFLESRIERLDGIVVTGGEPTVHPDLPELLHRIRRLGFSIKLDTNGTNPDLVGQLIKAKMLDYIAIDIKCAPDSYSRVAGVRVDANAICECVEMTISSGLPHELRMTFVEPLVSMEEIPGVAEFARGCKLFLVQPFQPSKALDPSLLRLQRPPVERLEQVCLMLQSLGIPATLR
jgi:pyruvate formate lyase activating enzyme